MTIVAPFPDTTVKPFARGKQQDSFTLSGPGQAHGHLWEGTVRSSKTVVSLLQWLAFVLDGPPGNLVMIGKTERSLKRNVLDVIVQWLGPKRAKLVIGAGELHICGRVVYLAGANDEGAVARIQGLTLVGFYGDEMSTWPENVFRMATTRLSMPGSQWFGTSNPDSKTHHLKVTIIDRAKLHLRRDGSIIRRRGDDAVDVHVYSFTLYDNPYLTPEFIDRMERSYSGLFYRRYILGEWCMAEGAIWDAWDDEQHVIPFGAIPTETHWLGAGVDYGTNNPFHAGTLALGPAPYERAGYALYVTSEFRYDSRPQGMRRRTDLEYARNLRDWLTDVRNPGPHVVRGMVPPLLAVDPSAASFRVQLAQIGIDSAAADNDVIPGIRDVGSVIAAERLFICEDAKHLIDEIPSYSWDDKAAKQGKDEPLKVDDHGCDQLRYIVRTSRADWWDLIFPEALPAEMFDPVAA